MKVARCRYTAWEYATRNYTESLSKKTKLKILTKESPKICRQNPNQNFLSKECTNSVHLHTKTWNLRNVYHHNQARDFTSGSLRRFYVSSHIYGSRETKTVTHHSCSARDVWAYCKDLTTSSKSVRVLSLFGAIFKPGTVCQWYWHNRYLRAKSIAHHFYLLRIRTWSEEDLARGRGREERKFGDHPYIGHWDRIARRCSKRRGQVFADKFRQDRFHCWLDHYS